LAICRHTRFLASMLAIVVAAVLPSAPAFADNNPTTSYDSQSGTEIDPHLHSLDEYTHGGAIEVSPLGLDLREDQRELKSGAIANGLLVVNVTRGSPAANAGLRAPQEAPKQILTGLAVAGSLAFPPAVLLVPVFASLQIGRDGDFIIAVDGTRVTNVLDFDDDIRDTQPGEIVYLTIIRSGARMQLQVHIPPLAH
jgi:S1-C subfamily serine protease